jgi:hypothetical protein
MQRRVRGLLIPRPVAGVVWAWRAKVAITPGAIRWPPIEPLMGMAQSALRVCPTSGQAAMPVLESVGRIGNPSHTGTCINRLVGQTLSGDPAEEDEPYLPPGESDVISTVTDGTRAISHRRRSSDSDEDLATAISASRSLWRYATYPGSKSGDLSLLVAPTTCNTKSLQRLRERLLVGFEFSGSRFPDMVHFGRNPCRRSSETSSVNVGFAFFSFCACRSAKPDCVLPTSDSRSSANSLLILL